MSAVLGCADRYSGVNLILATAKPAGPFLRYCIKQLKMAWYNVEQLYSSTLLQRNFRKVTDRNFCSEYIWHDSPGLLFYTYYLQ